MFIEVFSYIRLRVFAWGFCLGVSADFCVLLQATVLGFSNESQQKIAISKMFIGKPRGLARKRSGGRAYGETDESSNPPDRTAG